MRQEARAGAVNGAWGTRRRRDRRAALERHPDVVAWNLLGEILNRSDPAAAGARPGGMRSASTRKIAEASFHLGNRTREQGEHDAAIIHYERALRRAPRHAGVLNNLGLALQATGQPIVRSIAIARSWRANRSMPTRWPIWPTCLFAREAIVGSSCRSSTACRAAAQPAGRRCGCDAPLPRTRQEDARAPSKLPRGERLAPDSLKVQTDCQHLLRASRPLCRGRRARCAARWNSIPATLMRCRCSRTRASSNVLWSGLDDDDRADRTLLAAR